MFGTPSARGKIIVKQVYSLVYPSDWQRHLASSPSSCDQSYIALLRQRGVKLHVYLDVWLIRADTPKQDYNCMPRRTSGCFSFWLDHQLREVVSRSKSGIPVHRDAVQHSTNHSGAPTEDASQSPVRSSHWMANPNITARDLHRLLGVLVFMASLVQRGRLRLRPVQWWAATAWCQRTGSWTDRITVPQWVLSEVAWWVSPAVLQGLPLTAKETEVTLFTDASSSGWGAQLGSHSTKGQWSASQRSWHI